MDRPWRSGFAGHQAFASFVYDGSLSPSPETDQDISIQQCDPVGKDPDARVRFRVLRGDGLIGEFLLARSDDGWLPLPVPGSVHEGLLHATAIDFARDVNEGKVTLE
jgi:hypothetical protein